jgi:hypothetical protein
VGDVDVE